MINQKSIAGFEKEIIEFLVKNTPKRMDASNDLDHSFATAFQISCETLAKFGVVEETAWGAKAITNAQKPNLLPRWDDICACILSVAYQTGQIIYLQANDEIPSMKIGELKTEIPGYFPEIKINQNFGLGTAYVNANILRLLEKLSLVKEGKWLEEAEPILWRENPEEWALEIENDPRFKEVLKHTIETIPAWLKKELDQKREVSPKEIENAMDARKVYVKEAKKDLSEFMQTSANDCFFPTFDRESIKSGIESNRPSELDNIFYENWRFSRGWLSKDELRSAIFIFPDDLAKKMRRAVMKKLYPDQPLFAK